MVNRVQKWVIAVAIAIVFNLFINYGVQTFYRGPDYGDYCKDQYREPYPAKPFGIVEQQSCLPFQANESLQKNCTESKGYIVYKYNASGCPTDAYCETCGAMFDDIRKRHDGNVFVFLVAMGVVVLAAGLFVKAPAVSVGLLLAGVLDLIIAAVRYWEHLQNIFRFVILGVVLAILIWLGYKKVK